MAEWNATTIKALRKRLGMTQEDFAHEAGVTFATINRQENGHCKASRLLCKQFDALAERLDGEQAADFRSKV